jgi:hypothetical protein
MDGMSSSTDPRINLDMAMSDIRLKSELSTSTLKKGLDVQAQVASSLIESTQVPYPRLASSPKGITFPSDSTR